MKGLSCCLQNLGRLSVIGIDGFFPPQVFVKVYNSPHPDVT